jgi:pantoate kinase
MKKATAFAPGHISGFFQPIYHDNIYQSGSRGAGINLNYGATATVQIESASKQNIEIFIHNKKQTTLVIKHAIKQLISEKKLHIRINIEIELPISQGFGMSAASTLSASYALAYLLNIPFYDAIKASHYAEISSKTGLGDVAAEIIGGVEIRKEPGIPPWGHMQQIPGNWDVVVCAIDSNISTPDILKNSTIQKRIQSIGKQCTDDILKNPTLDTFFALSEKFTRQSPLSSKNILEIIDIIKPYGMCSMCMLGNAVFAVGKTDRIITLLSEFGDVQHCHVDQKGVRLL